jgi:hypothetical protein
MKPSKVRDIIKTKYPGLLKSGTLAVGYKDNILTLSGSIMAVQAMDKYVMQGFIPTECKAMEKSEDKGKATYTYRFDPPQTVHRLSCIVKKPDLKQWEK